MQMQIFGDLVTFLATPPGNFVYVLVIVFALIGTLYTTFDTISISNNIISSRLFAGLGTLLGLQLFSFLISGLIQQGIINDGAFFPVIDRAAIILSLVWFIWLWAFPLPSTSGDYASILISLLVVCAAIFGSVFILSTNQIPGSFNVSNQALFWNIAGIIILIAGFVALIVEKPNNWGTGSGFIFLAFFGFILDTFFPPGSGDYSGIIRIFLLAGFPMLFSLPTRYLLVGNISRQPQEKTTNLAEKLHSGSEINPLNLERRNFRTDPDILQLLLSLAGESDPVIANQIFIRTVVQLLLVDLGFLVFLGDDQDSINISSGYDLIREETLLGGSIPRETLPVISKSMVQGQSLILSAKTSNVDTKNLGELLGLSAPSNILCIPIVFETIPIGSILLLSPYSNREWNVDDEEYASKLAENYYPIIQRCEREKLSLNVQEDNRVSSKYALDQNSTFKQENDDLKKQLTLLKNIIQQATSENEILKAKLLELRNEPPKKNLVSSKPINDSIQVDSKSDDDIQVMASISQELRQPMSSIIGYADLLLGESVGILGALQRKFIERIRTSTERIGSLVDDLIQMNIIDSHAVTFKPENVDINIVIDNAMAYTSSQMREKNIALRIDIPENIKPLQTDRVALQQILIHLLQNAGSASPIEGSVTLRVRTKSEGDIENLIIQVSDSGGGIPLDELSRVFTRLYQADKKLIQGIGDKGVGLSIAKTLTNAQGGQIWAETETGVGSTISISLPISSKWSPEFPKVR